MDIRLQCIAIAIRWQKYSQALQKIPCARIMQKFPWIMHKKNSDFTCTAKVCMYTYTLKVSLYTETPTVFVFSCKWIMQICLPSLFVSYSYDRHGSTCLQTCPHSPRLRCWHSLMIFSVLTAPAQHPGEVQHRSQQNNDIQRNSNLAKQNDWICQLFWRFFKNIFNVIKFDQRAQTRLGLDHEIKNNSSLCSVFQDISNLFVDLLAVSHWLWLHPRNQQSVKTLHIE